jgi:DNA-binding transcriptional LysR family regulator
MRFLESARRILGDLDSAERDVVGESAVPTGHLRLTSSVTFGRTALVPIITGLLDAYPHVTASVLLVDRIVNLVEEGIDAAVRIGHLPDSSLMSRHVGEVRRILVASPEYLAKHGKPRRPADLRRHDVIVFTGLMPNREWTFVEGRGQSRLALASRLEINDAGAALAAAEQGKGITITLSYMVVDQIRKGRLVSVLDGFTPPAVPVQIVYPQAHLVAPKLRAFLDYATPLLRKALAKRDSRA